MPIIYTALLSKFEELKEPSIITPGWRYICFTDQDIKSDVWEIIKVDIYNECPRRMARKYKIKIPFWLLDFDSIWLDASFKINCNLTDFWNKHFDKDFSAPKHPWRSDVYAEITDCIVSDRGEKELLEAQYKQYKLDGVPANNGIIQSGILLRRHTPEVIQLCKDWWAELKQHSTRDQVSFAKVAVDFPYTAFNYHYTNATEFIYHHHYPRRFGNRYDEMIKNV